MRLAIVSLLFNWPAKGGGNAHTIDLATQLSNFGIEVRHFYARFSEWGLGEVSSPIETQSIGIQFSRESWNRSGIQSAFHWAVKDFTPDWVIVTDAWNFKPWLAEAVGQFPFLLRFDAMEGLCPLNNIRLKPEPFGTYTQCSNHQLAFAQHCLECVAAWAERSGSLHMRERTLSWWGVSRDTYLEKLHWSLKAARSTLVVNPLIGVMLEPYASRIAVVPGGIDASRFKEIRKEYHPRMPRVLFVGNPDEPIKGFEVLDRACHSLWQQGLAFELLVTAARQETDETFRRFIGWQSPKELPQQMASADIVVMPSICQDAMPLTALEAMAAGTPVVASRLGGLQFSVLDGFTGLLFNPGDATDLAEKLTVLLHDSARREQLGRQARKRVLEDYAWHNLIKRHYLPLLSQF